MFIKYPRFFNCKTISFNFSNIFRNLTKYAIDNNKSKPKNVKRKPEVVKDAVDGSEEIGGLGQEEEQPEATEELKEHENNLNLSGPASKKLKLI